MPTFSLIKKPRVIRYLLFSGLLYFVTAQQAFSQAAVGDMRKSALEATLPVVVLPSPNAATLTRTISEHVDLYTGKLNIEIPIYTLKSRNVELPISLIGAANSHKVNDISGWGVDCEIVSAQFLYIFVITVACTFKNAFCQRRILFVQPLFYFLLLLF